MRGDVVPQAWDGRGLVELGGLVGARGADVRDAQARQLRTVFGRILRLLLAAQLRHAIEHLL